ncbi:MAG TPA: DUF5686 family protein [Flavobacterium sp.]|nr:DUF5686 family protein [Flavobacterium sp.]
MKQWIVLFLFFTLASQAQQAVDHNPGKAIIKKTIRGRNANNPEKKLKSFTFKSYSKLIVSANPDSIPGKLDTVSKRKFLGKRYTKIDSTQYKFKKFIRRQHFFETEKVSQYQFDGNNLKETIIGTKMSGFREPIYEVLGFNLQSFSIYDEYYELFETKYNSPIASDAFSDYQYQLLDSVTIEGRKTYRVAFKNKKKRKKAGLEGILYIDSSSFAIAKADMNIKGVLNIRSENEFKYIPEEQLWFPTGRNLKITKGNNDEDVRLPGSTIKFDAVTNGNSKREKETSDFTYLLSETKYSDFNYNIPVQIKKAAIAIDVKDSAIHQQESFWNSYRKDSIDVREKNTYTTLDSIVAKEKIEKKLRLGRKIINGYIPFGPIDLDLRYLLSYNNYEGFRLGLGGITNDKFSDKYRVEGYSAYGTKDGNFKYNLGGAARIGRFSSTWVGGSYTDDVREIASTSFAIDKRVFKLYDPRPINVSTFYKYNTNRIFIETKIIPRTESIWQLSQSRVEPQFNYVFNANDKLYTVFHMTTAMASIQWNPFSEYMQTPVGRIEVEKRFPKFTFQFTQSLPKILDNDFEFGKIDFRGEYEKKYLDGQKSALVIEAGYAYGDVPLTHLYNTSPNSLTKDKIQERITIAGKNSFETMYFNEFFSSEYVMLQLKHGFKRVTLFGKVRPSLVLVTRMAWGNMEKPEQHIGIQYKTLDKGYFESGIELNQIYKGFGLSGFYRYGPNQLMRLEDNLSIKLSFILNIGF